MTARTIMVLDDEPASRTALSSLLKSIQSNLQVLQAHDAVSGLVCATQRKLDMAFIDIELPGQNGIELALQLLQLAAPPLVVFVTASNQYAVDAFNVNAVDYVVKPYSKERVEQALLRAESRLHDQVFRAQYAESIRRSAQEGPSSLQKLWAERENGARVLIDFSDIGWASARDKEVFIRVAHGELRVRMNLNELTEFLPTDTFVRVHRSHLVNIQLAREIISWDSHSMTLIMGDKNATEIPVSRTYVHRLKQIAGW